jgi:hypothetical protein
MNCNLQQTDWHKMKECRKNHLTAQLEMAGQRNSSAQRSSGWVKEV